MPELNPSEIKGGLPIATFLDLIAWSEGTSTSAITKDRGYDVIVSGVNGPSIFTDYKKHPFLNRPPILVRPEKDGQPALYSTASGRYQINIHTWKLLQTKIPLFDFSPESQDRAALELIRETGADALLLTGNVSGAIHLVSHIWASMPGNNYGQGGKSETAEVAEFDALKATEA